STFNDVTLTNGYHPLWMLVNIVLMWIAGASRPVMLYILVFTEIVILSIVVYQFERLTRRLGLTQSSVGLAILVLTLCTGLYGLETHASALMIVLFGLQLFTCLEKGEPRNWLILGVASVFVMLARLDNVFLIISAILLVTAHKPFHQALKRVSTFPSRS